ncbi:MAG: hypothetical protein ACK5PZ_16470, partial [Pirellula sp.]
MIETSELAIPTRLRPALTLRALMESLRNGANLFACESNQSHACKQVATGRRNPISPDASYDRNIRTSD